MTVVSKVLANRQTGLIAEIDDALVTANGWTKSGSTYTSPTVDGRTLSFTLTDTASYTQFVLPTKSGVTKTLYMYHGTSAQTVLCDLQIHAGPDFFYINTKGPGPGAANTWNNTWGSPRTLFGLFPMVPYLPADTAKPWVAIGGTTTTGLFYADAFVDIGINGVGWQAARLATIRPAIQDEIATGDSLPTRKANGLLPVWPFLVVENSAGLRGRLAHVYYGSEGYSRTGDTTEGLYSDGQRIVIDGATHRTRRAYQIPGSTPAGYYCAFGAPGIAGYSNDAADGGPIIIVKE